ncbi:hypothetical protein [Aestuariibaculum sediminum]|uniref:Carboxypeptidase-like regulatory domain-containing protein n=1 Tax=Aestuariibaculum sediminum TaxID=2770637 RepID=A0A8J6Q369_9FLAO|nr:hypothetical protein [Aestuariibaculum sediminum]MBD0833164.1 hypothetical protein [Aestuariibaculum sediminum]
MIKLTTMFMSFQKLMILLLFPACLTGQTLKGIVYDYKSVAKNIGVFNVTSKDYTYTSENGEFSIWASINDTLLFSSEFYEHQKLVVKENHFKDTNVIELKININKLNAVNITNSPKAKTFNAKVYSSNLGEQLLNDMKNRPYLYSPPPNPRGDLTLLPDLIRSLFKIKKREKVKPPEPIDYKGYYALFNKNNLFTETLLRENLDIKTKDIPLFFDFCGSKQLNAKLLSKENHMILLDSLVKFSRVFNEPNTKDVNHFNTD